MMAWSGEASVSPSECLQLSFEANGLRNRDMMGTSDPMLVAYGIASDGREIELGRSETIPNTLNPKWVYNLPIEYHFETIQPLRFVVYDVDSNYDKKTSDKMKLKKQDFLGEVRTTLAEIMAAPPQLLIKPLTIGVMNNNELVSPSGTLIMRAEKVITTVNGVKVEPEEVEFLMKCSGLENQEMFSKSDPMLRISKSQPDGTFSPVHQTEVKQNNLNPEWKAFSLTLQQLCNGDKHRKLKIEVWDYNGNGKHKLIGSVMVTFNQLQENCQVGTRMQLTRDSNPKHANKSRGTLSVVKCVVTPMYEFVDFILAGCEISFFVAIDFTASNGDPRSPSSLHYLDPMGRKPNAYQTAIDAVGGVLQHYDTDKLFPCWGFGGRVNGHVNHCFPLNNNPSDPTVKGILGIHQAYSQAIFSVELYGPTWFAPVVRQATAIAKEFDRQMKYFVLLIITDGAILDMQETISAIVDASYTPLSLLIVGVGNADFSAMDFLDADKNKLVSQQGRPAERDIVQFVPILGGSLQSAATKLLKELPGQVTSYMKKHHIRPVKPVPVPLAPLTM